MESLLKKAREGSGYSLEEIEKKTKIRKKYLLALEEGNLSEVPGEAYAKGYLKIYSDFLGVNPQKITYGFAEKSDRKKIFSREDKVKKYIILFSVFALVALGGIYRYKIKKPPYTSLKDYPAASEESK